MIIETEDLTHHYGRRVGIEDVTFGVAPGSLFGFLGPNGAGKTTTIRLLLGFLRPGAGRARVMGMECWRDSHRIKRRLGYLPGDLRLYPWMTARSGLDMVGRIRGMDLRAPGRALCEQFDLEMDVRVSRMSRGMRQKLGIVLALAPAPELLILDEPTSGLDPLVQETLLRVLRDCAGRGHTVLFSSHRLSEVDRLCDRVAFIRHGRIVANEALVDLRQRAGRAVTLDFVDEGAAAGVRPPEGLRLLRREGSRWYAGLEGPPIDLLRWMAGQPLSDFTIGPPDLDALFQRLYEPEAGADTTELDP